MEDAKATIASLLSYVIILLAIYGVVDIFRRTIFGTKKKEDIPPRIYPEAEFDIDEVDVFSIERTEDGESTIIGILAPEKKSGTTTWYLNIGPDAHLTLVKRLQDKIARRRL